MNVSDAAARGAVDRLCRILTTSITTIAGLIPLANAISFGLVASTLIALLIIPCLYLLLTPNKSVANSD